MSLWSRPPHVVTIYPAVPVDDGYGGTMPGEGEPVTLRALVQPRAAESGEASASGYATDAVYELAARSLPAGAWARVTYAGDDFTVIGEPRRYGVSRHTAHDVATIRRR